MVEIAAKEDLSKIQLEDSCMIVVKSIGLDPEKLFIVLRNLGISQEKVVFSFSGYDNEQKELEKWLYAYMTSDICVGISQFDEEMALRIKDFIAYWNPNDCNTYLGKYKDFALSHAGMLIDLMDFLSSSIYRAAALVSNKSIIFSPSTTMVPTFSANAMNLYSQIREFEVDLMLKKLPQFNYLMFDTDNGKKKLTNLAQTSIFALMLYGQTTPQWQLFQQLFSQLAAQSG